MCCFAALGNHVICNCGFLFFAYGGFNLRFILKFVSDIKLLFPGCNSQPVHAHWSWSNCRRSIITEYSWRCVCVCVCVCMRMYTHVCVCVCVCVWGWMDGCVCACTCACACIHVCLSVCLHVHAYATLMYLHSASINIIYSRVSLFTYYILLLCSCDQA